MWQGPRLGVTNHTLQWVQRSQIAPWSMRNPDPQSEGHGRPGGSWISDTGLGKLGVCTLCAPSFPSPPGPLLTWNQSIPFTAPLFLPGPHAALCAPVFPPTIARGPLAMLSPLKTPPGLPCALRHSPSPSTEGPLGLGPAEVLTPPPAPHPVHPPAQPSWNLLPTSTP